MTSQLSWQRVRLAGKSHLFIISVLFTPTLLFMARNFTLKNIPCEDQRVEDDYIDELIRKYLCSEDMNSLYEDTSAPLLTSPEADKWPGEGIFPADFDYNQDFLVPELFLLEDIDCLPEKYDDVEPEDELLSILEEIITEDENKTEGSFESQVKESDIANILKSANITNTDSETLYQETTSLKRKRPKRTSTDICKKGKRPCRQPIIMKGGAKRNREE